MPFADLRALDFSQVLAGPYVGRILAELGCDVIKVEAPRGDPSRVIGPRHDRGQSGLYTWANVSKRNICIDLTTEGGRSLAQQLIARVDIVICNFRPGVAERLGIGWQDVQTANPRAVLVSVSGYGDDSSRRDRGAYAPTIHAATGTMAYGAEKAGLPLHHTGDATADLVTALHSTIGVLAALRAAERSGIGQHVEVAMYDALLATYSETPYALLDPPEHRTDAAPYDAGPNGWIVVAGTPQHVWMLLRGARDLKDLAPPDADVPTKARLRHAAIERFLAERASTEDAVAALEAAGLPCAPVERLEDVLASDYAKEREILRDVDDRKGGTRRMTRLPYRFSQSTVEPRRPAPLLGEHNAEVLRELLDLSDAEIASLETSEVLRSSSPSSR